MPVSTHTQSHSGLSTQEDQFTPLCSVQLQKAIREKECSTAAAIYFYSPVNPLSTSTSLQTLHLRDTLTVLIHPEAEQSSVGGLAS